MSAAFTYEQIGHGYAGVRRPDPRIEAEIACALGDAKTVVNVGAGTGSYEPGDRSVTAVEPSLVMIRQRESETPVLRGVAEHLPIADNTFDAALAVLTMHHWSDWQRGVSELRRVASERIVVLTFDCDAAGEFWLFDYFPAILERDRTRFPPQDDVCTALGAEAHVVSIPHDCADGFLAAHWQNPEAYLDEGVRAAISGFAMLTREELDIGLARLQSELASGAWHQRYGDLLADEAIDAGYRLLVARLSPE